MNYYHVCIEERDNDGNVKNSEDIFSTPDREQALLVARESRKRYSTVVIETWDSENESLIDTTLEYQY